MLWPVLLAAILLTLAACGTDTPSSSQDLRPAPQDPTPTTPLVVNGLAAASEYLVGENRFPFGLVDFNGRLIKGAQVHVSFYRLHEDGTDELKSEGDAVFRQVTGATPHVHSGGDVHLHMDVRGVYVVDSVSFDGPGIWQARFQLLAPDASEPLEGSLAFQVQEESATLKVGDQAPPSRNPTARDVQDLTEITTHHPPVGGLYRLTVAEALQQPKPLVVVFATPQFCVTLMCGPVTDVVAQVYASYNDRANFIHIEPWELDTARNEGRLVQTEVVQEWRLPTEPWVFVMDPSGRVAARFEGLVTVDELSAALEAALQ